MYYVFYRYVCTLLTDVTCFWVVFPFLN